MTRRDKESRAPGSGGKRIYELEVSLLWGPVTGEFSQENPVILRTIQIRGDQTLERLHDAIFEAFDRWDEHMYEFQFGGKGPMDSKAKRFVLATADDPDAAGVVTRTTMDALELKKGQKFGYWFDLGDDWWHQIKVVAIHDGPGSGEYPQMTAQIGQSPPQYPGWDDEEDEEDE